MHQQIDPELFPSNFIRLIGKDCMLVASGTMERFNVMTANWGGVGYAWGKPAAFMFIRPERYTYEFLQANDTFTMSFLGEAHRDVHKICGARTGRDVDKVKLAKLHPFASPTGNILFEEAQIILECRKLYSDLLKPENFIDKTIPTEWYGPDKGGYHRLYTAEILTAWIN